MSGLTESSLIYFDHNSKEPKKNKMWYNRVYLCYQGTNINYKSSFTLINGFNCFKCNSFQIDNLTFNNKFEEYQKKNVKHIIIPICKWVPEIFDRYILNWKLKKNII